MRMPLRTGVSLERGHRLNQVALNQLGVAPGEIEWLTRDDNLARVPELLGERRVVPARGLTIGPRSGKAVVGHAADQQHIGGVVVLSDSAAHVLVEVGKVPVRINLGHAVGRDERSRDDLRHCRDPFEPGGVFQGRPPGRRRTHRPAPRRPNGWIRECPQGLGVPAACHRRHRKRCIEPTEVTGRSVTLTAGARADLEVRVPSDGAAVRVQLSKATAVIIGPPRC